MNRPNCTICLIPLPSGSLSVLGLHLCPACREKLLRQRPERREYDWYAGYVRRALSEPLLQALPG